ncbi:hypothetical protein [Paenibacillus pini]|uniref:Uncharacterized protein n=1 Tax=Paenibacillus pini JCM 16418 TaxID=1236976 RepID=W7YIB5_9BACL|nr:hypothetical protein [Paenibacillus pini]GAF10620.1 hypothetical protein JCM16418_4835 [Paenibacillus pini JCM 16418]
MAKFICKCGNQLSTVEAPNDVQLYVYSDREWDNIINLGDLIDPLTIPDPANDVWRCPVCRRIYVFNADNTVKVVYKIEDEE